MVITFYANNLEIIIYIVKKGVVILKGVILAGGTGSRLYPLTRVTNKHLLPVGRYPMIYHTLNKFKEAKVQEVMIVTGKEHMDNVVKLLGSGRDYGMDFTFKVQDNPRGIAEALGLCEGFIHREKFLVILGDNVFEDDLSSYVQEFGRHDDGCMLFLKEVEDAYRFGCAVIEDGKLIEVIEKPEIPPSNYCVTGIYMYDDSVFEIIKTLKPSDRGELEITDVNNHYISKGMVNYKILRGWWSDAGTFSSLNKANTLSKDFVISNLYSQHSKNE